MRTLYALLLIIFVAAIVVFVVQNMESISIKFISGSWQLPLALVVVAAYLLGMFSGWSVVGMVKTSIKRATEPRK